MNQFEFQEDRSKKKKEDLTKNTRVRANALNERFLGREDHDDDDTKLAIRKKYIKELENLRDSEES